VGRSRNKYGCLLPSDTPISRLSDAVPPYTANTPVAPPAGSPSVKFPKPRLPVVTTKTSAPPLGPGTTCELLLLLTNTLGGLLDAVAHKANDIVRSEEEEDGREKSTGVEEPEKLLPVRVRGVLKERELCARVEGRESNNEATSAQSDWGSMLSLSPSKRTRGLIR
jgi:hypothetical protein